jgi:hypothetical protein
MRPRGTRRRGVALTVDTTDIIRRIERELGMSETYQITTFQGIK